MRNLADHEQASPNPFATAVPPNHLSTRKLINSEEQPSLISHLVSNSLNLIECSYNTEIALHSKD